MAVVGFEAIRIYYVPDEEASGPFGFYTAIEMVRRILRREPDL
jgi:hypothetical protein